MLAGRMVDAPSDAAPRTLAVDIGLDQPIALPMAALAAVRFTSLPNEQAERELKARMAQREAARDLLIVPQAEKVVVLPGALERLTPKEWEFRFQTRSQTAALDRAYGVVFGAGVGSAARLPAKVHLRSDNTFGARLVEADDALLTLDAGQMGKLSVPWAAVRRIDLQSGRVTYVSDLKPSQTDVRPFLAAEWPPQKDRSVGGGPLSMRGEVFKKGLGVHATTALSFDIGAEFESFQAVVGIDDVVRPHGTAVFRVLGDGRELFRADDVSGGDEPRRIVVDVSGVKTLTLECSAGQELDLSDHCDWAEARLIRRAGGKAGRGT
jgi:hypothetical protein